MGRDGGSPRVARAIVFLVPVGFFVASVVATAANRDRVGHLVVATAVPAATLGLHLLHSTRAAVRRRKPWWPWSLAAHGVVTYAPYYYFQDTWVGIPGSLAAAVLLTTPVPHAWTAFVVLSAFQVPLVAALGETTWQGLNSAVRAQPARAGQPYGVVHPGPSRPARAPSSTTSESAAGALPARRAKGPRTALSHECPRDGPSQGASTVLPDASTAVVGKDSSGTARSTDGSPSSAVRSSSARGTNGCPPTTTSAAA
jgi:hypothetical protein